MSQSRWRALMIVPCLLAGVAACGQSQDGATASTAQAGATDHAAHAHHGAEATGQGTLTVQPAAPLLPGEPVVLTLRLTGADGQPLGPDALAVSHTEKLHVMIVDAGLEDYTHVHGVPGAAPGEWTVSFTPRLDRTYTVWADFKLAAGSVMAGGAEPHARHDDHAGHGDHGDHGEHGAGHHAGAGGAMTLRAVIEPARPGPVAIAAQPVLEGEAGGLTFVLKTDGPLRVGAPARATLSVADGARAPVRTLEPLMGAFAHLVGFASADGSMIHMHPLGTEPATAAERGGPDLTFEWVPQQAGPMRLFAQVRHQGAALTVPFTIVVAE